MSALWRLELGVLELFSPAVRRMVESVQGHCCPTRAI